jgi:hypothetical protein
MNKVDLDKNCLFEVLVLNECSPVDEAIVLMHTANDYFLKTFFK